MCKIQENQLCKVKKMSKNLNLGNFLTNFEAKYLEIANISEK